MRIPLLRIQLRRAVAADLALFLSPLSTEGRRAMNKRDFRSDEFHEWVTSPVASRNAIASLGKQPGNLPAWQYLMQRRMLAGGAYTVTE